MSFVKKAVKKIFKGVKRLWKNKWVRAAVGVGLGLFVAGATAEGGWSKFLGTLRDGDTGGFFKAVGETISSGFSRIVDGIGSAWQGLTDGGTAPGGGPDLAAQGLTGAPTVARDAIAEQTTKGFGNLFAGGSNSIGWGIIKGGFQAWSAMEQEKAAKDWYYEQLGNTTVWGMGAYGDESPVAGVIRNPFRREGEGSALGATPILPTNNFAETYEDSRKEQVPQKRRVSVPGVTDRSTGELSGLLSIGRA